MGRSLVLHTVSPLAFIFCLQSSWAPQWLQWVRLCMYTAHPIKLMHASHCPNVSLLLQELTLPAQHSPGVSNTKHSQEQAKLLCESAVEGPYLSQQEDRSLEELPGSDCGPRIWAMVSLVLEPMSLIFVYCISGRYAHYLLDSHACLFCFCSLLFSPRKESVL